MKEKDHLEEKAKPLEEEEVEVEKSIGCKERKEEDIEERSAMLWATPPANFSKRYPQATPQAMLQAKYLPSGYARGYASGKFFIICENFRDFQKYSRGLCPRLRFRQFLKKYLPSGYATGYF
ncbi:hypothetical protein T03_2895 [Trichinella britovi]|uniref:Uncharacterized protein n=1 Tax=Trichinella britovi TaxID=45882 RepID=A0A0V1CXP1_TRIBR|nr:hypothetical protein T03_2895 [Trichinella britovi]